MTPLDAATLRRFVELAGERLAGDWILIGGAVLTLLGVEHRSTVDIDIVGPDEAANAQTMVLMDIAADLDLPVESVNQAGGWFLRRIDGWRDERVELHRGRGATIHLPSATLYLLLKIERLSETDLADCEERLRLARRRGEALDVERILARLDELDAERPNARRERLRSRLSS